MVVVPFHNAYHEHRVCGGGAYLLSAKTRDQGFRQVRADCSQVSAGGSNTSNIKQHTHRLVAILAAIRHDELLQSQ